MENTDRIATVAAAARQIRLPDVGIVEDIAAACHVSPSTIRDWIRTGRLPARKFGRRWLISRAELLRFLASPGVSPRLEVLR
jgi:excisionase family DNA binding protein